MPPRPKVGSGLATIETHEDGSVARIAVLQTNRAGEPRHGSFRRRAVTVVTAAGSPRATIDLPPPSVGARKVKTETPAMTGDEDGGS